MKKGLKNIILFPFSLMKTLSGHSQAVGLLLMGCTALSQILANTPGIGESYISFWHKELFAGAICSYLPCKPVNFINDFLMAFFFLGVAMEIKREMKEGALATVRKSLLPLFAALGGMVFPALIFALFNGHSIYSLGWGIPMATDIAFSLAVLSLLGNKVPFPLKILLMSLAVMDDLGGIIVIALFYGGQIKFFFLVGALVLLLLFLVLNRLGIKKLGYYFLPGLLFWYFIYRSGIHGTIAGVLFAFSIPKNLKLESILSKPVNFFIMPLFGLANMAISLNVPVGASLLTPLSLGIILGLVIGKPMGIFIFSLLAHKANIARLPSGTSYKQLLGIGLLGGIGFTMSIFIATLAFQQTEFQTIAKMAIMTGSALSAVIGLCYLRGVLSENMQKDLSRRTGRFPKKSVSQAYQIY